jgi:hypothetical protein
LDPEFKTHTVPREHFFSETKLSSGIVKKKKKKKGTVDAAPFGSPALNGGHRKLADCGWVCFSALKPQAVLCAQVSHSFHAAPQAPSRDLSSTLRLIQRLTFNLAFPENKMVPPH